MANFPHLDPLIVPYRHQRFETKKCISSTFRLSINKKNLKVANPLCPVDDKQFLDQVLKPETVETFTQSLQNLWIFSAVKS